MGLVGFKFSTLGRPQLVIGSSEASKFLESLLGPALVKRKRLEEIDNDLSVDTPVTVLECETSLLVDELAANNIKKVIEVWSKNDVGELCIEDTHFFLQNTQGEKLLSEIFEMSGDLKFRLMVGINKFLDESVVLKKLLKQCALKIVVPQQCDKELLKHLMIADEVTASCLEFNCCALIGKEGPSLIRLAASPMEATIWPDSLWIPRYSRSVFLDRRAKMIDKQRSENPSINHTDACRRAVYYLGIDQTDPSLEIGQTI
jgi:hypothetical protein